MGAVLDLPPPGVKCQLRKAAAAVIDIQIAAPDRDEEFVVA